LHLTFQKEKIKQMFGRPLVHDDKSQCKVIPKKFCVA